MPLLSAFRRQRHTDLYEVSLLYTSEFQVSQHCLSVRSCVKRRGRRKGKTYLMV